MRFQVPQFIEVEDKIFGNVLTLKQFIYILGGGGLSFIIYTLIDSLFLALLPIAVVMVGALMLAFYKINNKPLINVVEAAWKYYFGSKLYIWKKIDKPIVAKEMPAPGQTGDFYVPKLSDSKLKDLTWSLDIKQSQNPAQNQKGRSNI